MSGDFSLLRQREELAQGGFSRFLERFALGFAALVCLAALVCVLAFRGMTALAGVLSCAVSAALFGLGLGFSRLRTPERWKLAAVLALCFLARLVYVLLIPTEPWSDYGLLYQAARASAAGDFSWAADSAGYFGLWAYQIPFVLYQAGVLKLFGSLWALKALNLCFMTGIDYLLYRIGREFLEENAALCAAGLYALWPGSFQLAPVLTNQHISLFFLLLALALLLREGRWPRLAVAGALLGVADLMRPEGVVILAALFCCVFSLLVDRPEKRRVLSRIGGFALVLAAYFLVKQLCALALSHTAAAPNGIGNGFPEWKFLLGLDPDSPFGGYSAKNEWLMEVRSSAERSALSREIIAGYLARWRELPALFLRKIRELWGGEEDLNWSLYGLPEGFAPLPGLTLGRFRLGLRLWEKGVYLLIWAQALVGSLRLIKSPRRRGSLGAVLCAAVLSVAFLVYLLIEVQTRYRYFVMPFVFLLAAAALEGLGKKRKDP